MDVTTPARVEDPARGDDASPPEARRARWLRTAFRAGAVADALALVPMTLPPVARLLWGVEGGGAAYMFAMGYGASLMLGWTLLLVWAARRPVERAFVAPLTMGVIGGLVVTEIAAVAAGAVPAIRMVPTWCLQAVLLRLFAVAYRGPRPTRAR